MQSIKRYWFTLYELRHFWMHLVRIDLKNKFRRSKLGILWTLVYPLCLSLIMGAVFSIAFHYELSEYMPYILSGIIFWELVSNSFNGGGYSLLENESFIRQCNHPLTMYTLKRSLVNMITFLISCIALMIWVIFLNPLNLVWGILSLPLTVVIYFLFAWGSTTIAGYTCVQYRDYPMMVPLILQMVWYVSPVFFQESLFESNWLIYTWFQINPVTHMLNLLRRPFLYGKAPSWQDFLFSMLTAVFIDWCAYRINKKKKKDLIFYL